MATDGRRTLLADLRAIVGRAHVLTGERATRRFRQGYRSGGGAAIAVVRPGSLVEQWRVVRRCIAEDVSLILQAANTGLTGGSTPDDGDYPGGVVVISTRRLKGVHLIADGTQVICLAGATLFELERALRPIGREPHSVIGSSCLGASVVGGICNNSGGALIRRGPAYTELALYGQVGADGHLCLVNHLGVRLEGSPEEILSAVERGRFDAASIIHDPSCRASDRDYEMEVRAIAEATPARFNADPRCLFESAGSAGKLVLFAVRLDTFAIEPETVTFYVGTNDPAALATVRRRILAELPSLPIAGEYIHRTAFDLAADYGKDTVIAVERLGTDRLPWLFAAKAWIDGLTARWTRRGTLSDRAMQAIGGLFPDHLPPRMREWRDRFEHHLLLKVGADSAAGVRALLAGVLDPATGDAFECTPDEAVKAFLHRFAVAGAAVRYRAVHPSDVADIVALDVALPRNLVDWEEALPAEIDAEIAHKLYYGHFFCHVFHQDYVVRAGADPASLKQRLLGLLEARGAEYPAEHNVGHAYRAKPALERHYRALDPRNQLNPGIGATSRARGWGKEPEHPSRLFRPGNAANGYTDRP